VHKPQSLADFLCVPSDETPLELGEPRLEDISDPKEFAQAVLNSREFRQYIVNGLILGNISGFSSILLRVMDLAGWQRPPDRVEHTGKDGAPIETVRFVRVIVDPRAADDEEQKKIVAESVH
jgi:hypothetical protein